MDGLMRYKGTISLLLLAGGLALVYFQFIQGTDRDPIAITSTVNTGINGVALGNEVVVLLNEINRIELDVSIFDDPAFNALVDRRKEIEDELAGRRNPFELIGFGENYTDNVATPTAIDIQIIDPSKGSSSGDE